MVWTEGYPFSNQTHCPSNRFQVEHLISTPLVCPSLLWLGTSAYSSGHIGQEVLPRTSAVIRAYDVPTIELRFTTSLPASGRTILGQKAWQILGVNLVELVQSSLIYANLDQQKLQQHVASVERQRILRSLLADRGLVAFIANGSILPRASGTSEMPMAQAVPFQSPKALEVVLDLPDGSEVSGMGIRRGITLLTGGGFHGKSTVLEALKLGVYDHIPGDGREMVVTEPNAVSIASEDGRSVTGVDISPFITNLPGGKDTVKFSTVDASGSTSMAASIQEALEVGCKTLLIDEDTSGKVLSQYNPQQSIDHPALYSDEPSGARPTDGGSHQERERTDHPSHCQSSSSAP
jgi:predicted ABC-class ATPase